MNRSFLLSSLCVFASTLFAESAPKTPPKNQIVAQNAPQTVAQGVDLNFQDKQQTDNDMDALR